MGLSFHVRCFWLGQLGITGTPAALLDRMASALFKCVRGDASGFFKRRYSFQLVGVLLSVVPDIGRCRFADRPPHILWGERENEGHWIVGLSAVAKAKESAGFGLPMCTNKLQFALSIRHWTCRLVLLEQNDQSRRLVPRRTTAAGSGEPSLLHIGLFGLDRRARDRAVRTEHTTIAGFCL